MESGHRQTNHQDRSKNFANFNQAFIAWSFREHLISRTILHTAATTIEEFSNKPQNCKNFHQAEANAA